MVVPSDGTSHTIRERRAGWRRFALGMIAYLAAVVVQSLLLQPDRFALPVALALALAPMAPAVWAMGGWLRAMGTLDELQQRIHVQAALVALGTVAVLSFSYGLLEATLDAPRLSMFVVWPAIVATYSIALAYAQRRWFSPEA